MKRAATLSSPAAVTLAAALSISAAGCGRNPDARRDPPAAERDLRLVAVPHPDLAAVSAELRVQVEELRAAVSGTPGAHAGSAGEAWGGLARVYHAYGFQDAAAAAYENARALEPEVAAWSYGAGLLERARGRHDRAVELFRAAAEIDGASAATRFHLGESLLDLGQTDAAMVELAAAARSAPHAAAALALSARAERDQGDPARALELYERALAEQPSADLLYHSIAVLRRGLGDEAGAREALARAGQTAPVFPDPAAEELAELRTTSGALLLRGGRALSAERPREAVENYRRAVAAAPDDAEARRGLALALHAAGDLDAALAELDQAALLDPKNHAVAFDRGNVQMARGAHQAAADTFAECLALEPDFVPARFNLANAQLLLGRAGEALENLERVLELEPGHQRARYQAAMAKARLGRQAEAQRDLGGLLDGDPDYTPALLGLGDLRRLAGDRVGARAAYERVAAGGGEPGVEADALIGLAALAREESRVQDQIESLRSAVALAPARDDVREELARALEGAGRFLEAAEERRSLVELRPAVAMERVLEATAWVLGGRGDVARERLEEGLERLPDDPLLANSLARLLATARDPAVRDGRRAVELALRLNAQKLGLDAAETLAMAHAEAGEFSKAVAIQSALIEQVRGAGRTQHLPRLEENLRRFERGEPVRM